MFGTFALLLLVALATRGAGAQPQCSSDTLTAPSGVIDFWYGADVPGRVISCGDPLGLFCSTSGSADTCAGYSELHEAR